MSNYYVDDKGIVRKHTGSGDFNRSFGKLNAVMTELEELRKGSCQGKAAVTKFLMDHKARAIENLGTAEIPGDGDAVVACLQLLDAMIKGLEGDEW
jgi:hypothetical protein